MTTVATIALSEYLRTSYSPDREWVDGEVRERNMGDGLHSVVQVFFIKYFALRDEELGVAVRSEFRTQVAKDHFRVPDVALLRGDEPFEVIGQTPPLLCIEVLSPDDSMTEMYNKVDDYLRMGVRAVWVIDPRRRKGMVTEGGDMLTVEELTVSGTAIRVTMAEVLSFLDKQMRAGL